MTANSLRQYVAQDIACKEIPYDIALDVLNHWDVFGTWDEDELNRRPVNVDELRSCIEQELGLA